MDKEEDWTSLSTSPSAQSTMRPELVASRKSLGYRDEYFVLGMHVRRISPFYEVTLISSEPIL